MAHIKIYTLMNAKFLYMNILNEITYSLVNKEIV